MTLRVFGIQACGPKRQMETMKIRFAEPIDPFSVLGGRQAEQKVVTIGRLGSVTPELARRKANTILGGVATGQDPAADVKARRKQMRMAALIDLYEKEGCVIQRGKRQGYPMKAKTTAYTMARLRHHVVPLLGRRVVAEITAGDI